MSEQRRMRAELRQGLHQFLMTLYRSYSQSLDHERAVEQIGKCIKEEFQYFTKQSLPEENSSFDFKTIIQQLEKAAKKEPDAYKQMELYTKVETLSNAQEIIQEYAAMEESV